MKNLIHRFASLRVTIVLLVLLLVSLSAGTIVESRHGAPAALALVYHSAWFRALLAVFGLNLVCSLIDLWPWGRRRIGYALVHGSMLVILAGSLMTELLKTEGVVAIWEGEQATQVTTRPAQPGEAPQVVAELPFAVKLDSFEVDYYQGTRRPSQYRSRVTVQESGSTRPAVIEMNRPLEHGGYTFFQSSYIETEERDQTILSVSKDPGEPVVFLGYYGLVAGMLVVLGTRIGERRRAARPAAAAALAALALVATPARAQQAVPPMPSPADVEALRALPVQHDGRVMPLDTLAREGVWNVTGKRSVWGIDPVAMVLGWTFDPRAWQIQPIVRVGDRALAEAIGLPPGSAWASFDTLAQNDRLAALAGEAQAARQQEQPLTKLQKSAQALEERLYWMVGFFRQESIKPVPGADPNAAWTSPPLRGAADLRAVLDTGAGQARLSPELVQKELAYNRARPTRIAWIVLGLSLLLSIAGFWSERRALDIAAGAALVAGFLVMSWGIWMRWGVAGRIPASNMYESLLFLGWGVGAFAVIATVFVRNRIVVLNAAAGAAVTMALTDLLPIDRFIHPMPPVLSGTYWLAIHVPIIMVGYAVLALGVVVAHMQMGFEAFAPARRSLALRMVELQYFYIHVGSIMLVAGILTGSMWAAESWGRYWGWDPKEVWSLVAFLAYMAILHARAERLIGNFGVAAWSIVAFQTILMTYLGVNFVLASGLHSYGFGSSGIVDAMALTALAELAFIGVTWARLRAAKKAAISAAA